MAHDVKLGVKLDGSEQRDAIHVAIAPVIAVEHLLPGDHVGLVDDTEHVGKTLPGITPIGIIDPFLRTQVQAGERCWLFLYTQTITSLRHDWTHPAFAALASPAAVEESEQAKSERWLRVYAEEVGVSYRICMDAAAEYLASKESGRARWGGEYHTLNYDTPDIVYEKREEFWNHYEIVTGVKVEDKEATFFSCSC